MKNRSTKEIQQGVTIDQRHFKEKQFFQTTPWNSLPQDRVGIASLKNFLGKLLYDHIRSEFPVLVQEIRTLVVESRAQLDSMGPSRQTFMEQRQFLTRLAVKYQSRVHDCLVGSYDNAWKSNDPRKLRMHLQMTNDAFSKDMAKRGHTRTFRLVNDEVDKEFVSSYTNSENIYDWIRQVYRESRGSELPGTVNPTVLENMFRQQSKKWNDIATQHIADVERIVTAFNEATFQDIFYEATLREKIETRNNVPFREAAHDAVQVLRSILADERESILQTVNHYFADTLSATRQDRVVHRLKGLGLQNGTEINVDLKAVANKAHLSNEDQAVNDIHDILKAYYKVALKRFTDNIVIQVVERCYLSSTGPIKSISAEYIGGLPDTDLAHLAAENYATSSSRNDVNAKLERLEKALAIAEKERS